MADVADGQHVADHAVAVAVDLNAVLDGLLDVFLDHLALELSALVGVKAHVVCLVVELQSVHVQLAGGAIGGLAVVPDNGLVLVGYGGAVAAAAGAGTRGGAAAAAAAGSQAKNHSSSQGQCKSFLHNDSPFLCKLYRVFPVDSISHV